MEKYYVCYHILGNKEVHQVVEKKSLVDVLLEVEDNLNEAESIIFTAAEGHMFSIKTKSVTHFEIMSKEKKYEKDIAKNIGLSMRSALR